MKSMIDYIRQFLRDIRNYFYAKHIVNINQDTAEWTNKQLRVANFSGKIYTVINYPPEYEQDDVILMDYIKSTAMQYHIYLGETLGLRDLLVPNLEPIENTYSWLLYYDWNMPSFSLGMIVPFILRLCVLSGISYGIYWAYTTLQQIFKF